MGLSRRDVIQQPGTDAALEVGPRDTVVEESRILFLDEQRFVLLGV
jgi:hypothetical protein